jgi:uncharacterized integral membrane protein
VLKEGASSGKDHHMADGIKANLKLTGISVAVILVLIVILQNTDEVETSVLWLSIRMPRALLLLTTFAVGFGSGYLVHLRRAKRGRPDEPTPSTDLPVED